MHPSRGYIITCNVDILMMSILEWEINDTPATPTFENHDYFGIYPEFMILIGSLSYILCTFSEIASMKNKGFLDLHSWKALPSEVQIFSRLLTSHI